MHATTPPIDPFETACTLARTVLRTWARAVDAEGRFPAESVDGLRRAGLLAPFVPVHLGGLGGGFSAFAAIAASLGEECLSTALIWAMHGQQVAVLARHSAESQREALAAIVRDGLLVASVTTEAGKGGELLAACSPLVPSADGFRIHRAAPIVSYGAEASYFLVTMRAAADRPPNDVRLVLVERGDGEIRVTGGWDAMGMRGTRSVPMAFDVTVPPGRILAAPFPQIAAQSLVPAGHVGWSAAWFGAARGAFTRFVRLVRRHGAPGRGGPPSGLFFHRLAELRTRLDLVRALLERVAARLDSLTARDLPASAYSDIGHAIELNNLKLVSSSESFAVVDGLIELAGLGQGYLREQPSDLERVFRDLRSATLMFHNDRLLEANGKLLMVEGSPMGEIWGAASAEMRLEPGGEIS